MYGTVPTLPYQVTLLKYLLKKTVQANFFLKEMPANVAYTKSYRYQFFCCIPDLVPQSNKRGSGSRRLEKSVRIRNIVNFLWAETRRVWLPEDLCGAVRRRAASTWPSSDPSSCNTSGIQSPPSGLLWFVFAAKMNATQYRYYCFFVAFLWEFSYKETFSPDL